MGRTKVQIILESDTYTAMEILDNVFEKLSLKKNDGFLPFPLRYDPLIEITDYVALDWRGRTCSDTPTKETEE